MLRHPYGRLNSYENHCYVNSISCVGNLKNITFRKNLHTLSSRRSFSTSISSPMLTSSFLANCMVGIAITFDMSQFGKTYCNSLINLLGQIWADMSRNSFSIWWDSKMWFLLVGRTFLEKVVTFSIGHCWNVCSIDSCKTSAIVFTIKYSWKKKCSWVGACHLGLIVWSNYFVGPTHSAGLLWRGLDHYGTLTGRRNLLFYVIVGPCQNDRER